MTARTILFILSPTITQFTPKSWEMMMNTGTETWQPEILQIMNDHGFSPEDFKEEELNTEEEPEGEFLILLPFYPFADMTCHWH